MSPILPCILLSCLVLFGGTALADSDDESGLNSACEELFVVEIALPQEQNEVQFTLLGQFLDREPGSHADGAVEIEYGFTDWLQASAELALVREAGELASATGLGDVELGAMAVFYRSDRLLAAGALEVLVPTGDETRGLGAGEVGFEPSLRLVARSGEVNLHAVVGVDIADDEVGLEFAGAAEFPVGDSILSLELVGELEDETTLWLVPGWSWLGAEPFEFGVGVVVGALGDVSWGGVFKALAEF